jgi:hypothetical protein
VMCHPIVLQQPIRDQMRHESAFEGRQAHGPLRSPSRRAELPLEDRR